MTGRITGIAIHPTTPSTMYVTGARGGVWKTTDGGATWTPKSDNEISLAIGTGHHCQVDQSQRHWHEHAPQCTGERDRA